MTKLMIKRRRISDVMVVIWMTVMMKMTIGNVEVNDDEMKDW